MSKRDFNYPLMLRRLNFVPRWGIIPTIRQQSVGEHTFGVNVALRWLFEHYFEYSPETKLKCYEYAIAHDAVESITGDIPTPFKRKTARYAMDQFEAEFPHTHVDEHVKRIVGLADKLEAIAFLWEEERMGNQCVKNVIEQLSSRFVDQIKEVKLALKTPDSPHHILQRWLSETDPSIHPGMLYV